MTVRQRGLLEFRLKDRDKLLNIHDCPTCTPGSQPSYLVTHGGEYANLPVPLRQVIRKIALDIVIKDSAEVDARGVGWEIML